ncbi:MAG: LysR family transcriptional regulator [Acidobacteriia bacterium]|nr:LysR family transcriptional regulator [Terriglobia bacterium]
MNVNQLRYFVAVAEELHFGRAAQKLGMAQPPLSQQIRRLEDDLGVQLLQRTKRRVQLTDAGRAFLEETRKTLSQLGRAVEAARGAGRGEVGRLAIGFLGAATYSLLPTILVAFRNAFPKVEIELHELKTSELIQALRERRVNVGFVRLPVHEEILEVEPILSEELVVALPERHALAAKPQIYFRDLSDETFLMPPRHLATSFYDQVLNLCNEAGFSPKLGAEASQLQTIINLVAGGMGITLVPESVATLTGRGVVFKHLPAPTPMMEVAVAWRRDVCSEVLMAFLKVVREVAHQSPR